MSRTGVALVGALLALTGCAEHVMLRSGPSGAQVSVNGTPVGTTPVEYSVSRGNLDNVYEVQFEKKGYAPTTTTLRTRLAGGRVTGAIFTVGILWVFRSMHSISPVFVQLEPVAAQDDRDRALGEALRNLHDLHERGQISDEELQRRQQELLRH